MSRRSLGDGRSSICTSLRGLGLERAMHLGARFFGSLLPRRVSDRDTKWVESKLTNQEYACWQRLPRADRVEAVAVARRFCHAVLERSAFDHIEFEPAVIEDCIAGALMHDVGKIDCDLGTYRRALATIAGAVAGHDIADAWSMSQGVTRQFGLYLRHGELGKQRIIVAGGRVSVAQWAAVHHAPEHWTTTGWPAALCRLLAIADGERVHD